VRSLLFGLTCVAASLASVIGAAQETDGPAKEKLRVLIIDGQNNHAWQSTTPLLQQFLRRSGRFTVDVATSPRQGGDMSGFRPKFAEYDVVMSNYNGQRWPKETEADFVKYVKDGGGFVPVHAANNAFADWPEYNEICGLGGWFGRDANSGPYVYINNDGEVIRDNSPGRCGHHGPQHEYQLRSREPEHPIMNGLPEAWLHTQDELYDSMRGPAKNMNILATAFSAPEQNGTNRHEPLLMTLKYGDGRIFHTMLGHADYSMQCVGFVTTLLRGTEWAATGEVTIPVPDNFPTADSTSVPE